MVEDKKSDFEKVSLSKVAREISKAVEKSPSFKELFEGGKEIWKIIPKKQYAKIITLSVVKGVFDGLVTPKLTGAMVNAGTNNAGLNNPKVFLFGGLNHFISSISSILAASNQNKINNMLNEISTEMYSIACKNFITNDAEFRKKIGLPSFSTSARIATNAISNFIQSLSDGLGGISSIVSSGANVFPKHPIMGTSLAIFSTITTMVSLKYTSKIQKYKKEANKSERETYETAQHFADNADLFQRTGTLNIATQQIDTLLNKNRSDRKVVNKKILKEEIIRSVVNGITGIATFAALYFSAVKSGDSLGDFVSAQQSMGTFFRNAEHLTRVFPRLKSSILDYKEAMEILNNQPQIIDKEGALDLTEELKKEGQTIPTIEFKNVKFSYDKDKKLFENLNLTINPREKVAIVGPSGNGKTSLINLLDRFYDLEENSGSVKVGGIDVKDLKQESLRKNICYIPSDNGSFFPGSIKENLGIINPDISDKDVEFALGCVNLEDMISDINNKNRVAEFGKTFSEGQKQRLNIARSFLSQAPVVIFDEPTSNVGGKDKEKIIESMRNTSKDKTSIVITHEADVALKFADRIIFLKEGQVVEDGKTIDLFNDKKSEFFKYAIASRLTPEIGIQNDGR